MPVTRISEETIQTVVAVARREGWVDLRSPVERHPPRTLGEVEAIARFQAARREADRRRSRPGRERTRPPAWAWALVAALALAVLGACWYVSPGRTVAAAVGVAVFCAIALLRRGKGRRRDPRRPSSVLPGLR